MKTYDVFIGLGSNVGVRHRFLQRAASELGAMEGLRSVWFSSVYETDPYGNKEQAKFLNAVCQAETSLMPHELLPKLQNLEEKLGRNRTERWGPREIDLDILLYDGLVAQEEGVIVPHPELDKRRFVLVPLREIAPELVHPLSGLTMEELASACGDEGRVVKTSFHLP